MKETHIVLRPALNVWTLLVLGLALLVLALIAYRRTTRQVPLSVKGALIALRVAGIGLLFMCLLRPAVETTTYSIEKRPLVLLVDRSRSMSAINDTPQGVSRLEAVNRMLEENARGLEKLKEKYELTTLGFARDIQRTESTDPFWTSHSAYGRALEEAREQMPLGQCDGIILIGDGSHNLDPPDPLEMASALADRGIPLYTVGIGREQSGEGVRDVKVLSLDAPRTAYVYSVFAVRGKTLFRGCRGLNVKMRLEVPGQEMQFQSVPVAHDEEIVPVEFQVSPQKVGEYKLSMRAEELEGEILLDNNVRSAFVKVVSGGLRVGYLDSLRPESKFVTRALQGAEHISLNRIVLLGRKKVSRSEADWSRCDVVILGDVSAFSFGAEELSALKSAVQEQGKGLIFMAGKESTGSAGFGGTVVADVLPVELPREMQYVGEERAFRISAGAAGHPVFALPGSPGAPQGSWSKLSPLSGVFIGARPKGASQTLAQDQQGNPLLVVHRSGAGRVACVLTDTSFRWFFTEAQTQDMHRLFWRQLVLWAGALEEPGKEKFWITLTRSELAAGEPVVIQAHALDADGKPIRDASMDLTVEGQAKEGTRVDAPFSRQQGFFQGEYTPRGPGEYIVRAEATRAGKSIGKDSAFFLVLNVDRELENPIAELSLLRRLSAVTADSGGKYCFYTNFHHLLDELAQKAEPLRLSTSRWREIWDRETVFALFVLVLAAEWGIRRWKGLV